MTKRMMLGLVLLAAVFFGLGACGGGGGGGDTSSGTDSDDNTNQITNLSAGLIGLYSFEMDASDSTPFAHDAIVHNVTIVDGLMGSAYQFDGMGHIALPDSAINKEQGTVSVWIKPDSSVQNSHIFSSANTVSPAGTRLYIIYENGSIRGVFLNDELGGTTLSDDGVNSWHHLVLAWNGNVAKFYVDGFLQGTVTSTGTPSGTNVGLGSYGNGMNSHYSGLIDEVAIYNRELNDDEVQELKAIIRPPIATNPGDNQGLYFHDRFRVTAGAYAHTANNDTACKSEFGSGYRLADWDDVVAYYNSGASMSDFFTNLGLPAPDASGARSLHVSRNGSEMASSSRHYFITRHDHNKPGSYLAHANINNYLVSLGSWDGNRHALCYDNSTSPIADQTPEEVEITMDSLSGTWTGTLEVTSPDYPGEFCIYSTELNLNSDGTASEFFSLTSSSSNICESSSDSGYWSYNANNKKIVTTGGAEITVIDKNRATFYHSYVDSGIPIVSTGTYTR